MLKLKKLLKRLAAYNAQAAEARWKCMAAQSCARSVVPPPSNQKIVRKLTESSRVQLGETNRNTIFVFNGANWMMQTPIAIASKIVSRYPGERVATLQDILVLGPITTSMDVSLIIPNTLAHHYVVPFIGFLPNFGAMDDCIFPACKECRRAAQCLTNSLYSCVVATAQFTQLKSEDAAALRPGDRYNRWTMTMRTHTPRPLMPPVSAYAIQNFGIWLEQLANYTYALEFVRTTK